LKYFPFKILIICILLPPVLYILSMQTLESQLQKRYAKEMEDIYIGDTAELFQGSTAIRDAISRNIDQYLQSKTLLSMGVKIKVTVITKENTILYPAVYEDSPVDTSLRPSDTVAQENFRLLNEGLLFSLDLTLEHNRVLSNGMLGIYILLSLLVLFAFYRASGRKMVSEEQAREAEIKRLATLEKEYAGRLKTLDQERDSLSSEIALVKNRLVNEKEKKLQSEDEMLEEMVSLEEKLNENFVQQKDQQEEIETLEEKIEQYEHGEKKSRKQKDKAADMVQKRFRTLYKNLVVNDRAAKGFAGLTADLQLKAEEIVHLLNDDPSLVTIKRKVFGKKNRETVLEVIFAYKGRLYFRSSKEHSTEIVSIGTKHTQSRDLGFLDNL
jgi:uncharacterized protein YlxW (UPF0749 family)